MRLHTISCSDSVLADDHAQTLFFGQIENPFRLSFDEELAERVAFDKYSGELSNSFLPPPPTTPTFDLWSRHSGLFSRTDFNGLFGDLM